MNCSPSITSKNANIDFAFRVGYSREHVLLQLLDHKSKRYHRKYFLGIVRSYHVTYAFLSEPTLCSCLNSKEFFGPNRHDS